MADLDLDFLSGPVQRPDGRWVMPAAVPLDVRTGVADEAAMLALTGTTTRRTVAHRPDGDWLFVGAGSYGTSTVDQWRKLPAGPDLSGSYSPLNEALEGVPVLVYGDSYSASDNMNSGPATRWVNRLGARLSSTVTNRAVSGYRMADVALDAIGENARKFVTPTRGLVLVNGGTNDILHNGGDSKALTGYVESARAFLHLVRAGSRIEETNGAFTYTGTWSVTTVGNTDFSAGANKSLANGQAGSVAIAVTGPCVVLVYAVDSGGAASVEVLVDGTAVAAKPGNDSLYATSASGASRGYSPVTFPLLNLTGAHTVTVRRAAGSTVGQIFVDALLIPSATPPTVAFVGPTYLTTAGYNAGSASVKSTDATVDAYWTALQTLAAEFPTGQVAFIDPRVGWVKGTMLGSDGIHPTDQGEAFLARKTWAALSALDYRAGQNT